MTKIMIKWKKNKNQLLLWINRLIILNIKMTIIIIKLIEEIQIEISMRMMPIILLIIIIIMTQMFLTAKIKLKILTTKVRIYV